MKNSILIKLFSKVYILFEKQFRKATQSKAGNKPYIAIQTSLFNNSLCIQHTFKIYTHNIFNSILFDTCIYFQFFILYICIHFSYVFVFNA